MLFFLAERTTVVEIITGTSADVCFLPDLSTYWGWIRWEAPAHLGVVAIRSGLRKRWYRNRVSLTRSLLVGSIDDLVGVREELLP